MSEPDTTENLMRRRTDRVKTVTIVGLLAVGPAVTAGLLAVGVHEIRDTRAELRQSRSEATALADQVRKLGATPVVEPQKGEPGPAGPQGPVGPQGARGLQGLPGKAGVTPPCLMTSTRCEGKPGLNGKAGADGTDGTDGTDGEPGSPGADGKDGVAGKDGQPGQDGKDGADGRGITSVDIVTYDNGSCHLIVTYDDAGKHDAGEVPCSAPTPPALESP